MYSIYLNTGSYMILICIPFNWNKNTISIIPLFKNYLSIN